MGKSKDLATLKSGLSIDGTLETTSVGTNLTSNSYNIVRVQTDKDDTAAADGILQFTHGSSNTVKGEIRYDASESMFELGHGDNQGHVRIDGSGRVTMPSQPSFSRRGQYGWQTKSSVDNIGSWYDGYDNTNMLNASTGVATAPVAGKYMVNFLMYVNDTTTTAHYARPYVNGSVYKDAICYLSSNNGYDNTSSATWFINLSANDTVQWYHLGDIYGYHTWWNMHLLG